MNNCLTVALTSSEEASKSDLAALGFGLNVAARLDAECDILVLGATARTVASSFANRGPRRVLVGAHPDLLHPTGEAIASAIAHVAQQGGYRLVVAANNTISRDALPRVAARWSAPMVSDVVEIREASLERLGFTKPCFSGNLLAEVEVTGPRCVVMCRASSFDPPPAVSAAASIEPVALPDRLSHPRKRFVELSKTPLARPELTEADIVVSGGRGTRGADGFRVLEELADLLGAAVGASRAAVDAGWMPNDFQVGQTGKVIAPKLYIGCGVSGAIQHLAGMRNSKTIVVINKDPQAPLFEVADYGLVADLFDAVPKLAAAIRQQRRV